MESGRYKPQNGLPLDLALHYANKTVMFADVVESVRLIQRDEIAAATRIRRLLLEAANEIVPAHRGHLLQRLGDGLMIDFADPRHAAACASDLHRRAAEMSSGVDIDKRVLLRVGIHVADILTDDVNFYGHGVNLAARFAALAGPGETVISAAVRDRLSPDLDGEITDLGECHLKHIETPHRGYRLGPHTRHASALEGEVALRPTVVIIPLALRSGSKESLAVGEIIADEVITALSRTAELRVVSRLSTTAFRGRKTDLKEIRSYLGATYVLSGAYHVSGDRLVVNVELADARTSEAVWAQTYRTTLRAMFALDDDLIASIVDSIGSAIMDAEIARAQSRSLPTLDAYTLLLGGIGLMHRSDPRAFHRSRQAFEQLIERFPRYSAPYAYLAEWHVFKVTQGWFTNLAYESAAALDYINRALDAEPPDSLAFTVHGLVHTNLLRDHAIAEKSYNRALAMNPNDGLAWLHRGTLRAFQGRGAEALEETLHAAQLSPLDPWRYYYDSLCATAALAARDYERAIALAQRSLKSNRMHASTLRVIAIASAELGRMDEARAAVAELLALEPTLSVARYRARSPAGQYDTGRAWSLALQRAGLPE
jgi:class 3 adenylate cyclase/TolB-like protein/Tfp pilus assembly protein PilF